MQHRKTTLFHSCFGDRTAPSDTTTDREGVYAPASGCRPGRIRYNMGMPTTSTETRRLTTFDETVRALRPHYPREWFRARVKDGSIPHLRVGRRRLFDLERERAAILDLAASDL